MTTDMALDLALAALEYIHEGANNQGPHTGISWRCVAVKAEPAIKAIKQARALDRMAENAKELGLDYEPVPENFMDALKFDVAMREWVGLTHEEIDYQAKKDDHAIYFALGALWAEAKLKEKNT